MPNTTRRKFIIDSVFAGIGIPLVTGLFPEPPSTPFSAYLKDINLEKGFYFAGVFETPIREGECVKDLVQPTSYVYEKEWQVDGCTVASHGEVFVVVDSRYCRIL